MQAFVAITSKLEKVKHRKNCKYYPSQVIVNQVYISDMSTLSVLSVRNVDVAVSITLNSKP